MKLLVLLLFLPLAVKIPRVKNQSYKHSWDGIGLDSRRRMNRAESKGVKKFDLHREICWNKNKASLPLSARQQF